MVHSSTRSPRHDPNSAVTPRLFSLFENSLVRGDFGTKPNFTGTVTVKQLSLEYGGRYASKKSVSTHMPDDADLLSIIQACHVSICIKIRIHWVKGHQDTGDRQAPLSLVARIFWRTFWLPSIASKVDLNHRRQLPTSRSSAVSFSSTAAESQVNITHV